MFTESVRLMQILTLHGVELPGPAAAHSNVPDISGLDHIMKGLHGFFDLTLASAIMNASSDCLAYRSVVIKSVKL